MTKNRKPIYIYLKPGKVFETREVQNAEGVNIDLNKEGEPLGIEVLNYQKITIDGTEIRLK